MVALAQACTLGVLSSLLMLSFHVSQLISQNIYSSVSCHCSFHIMSLDSVVIYELVGMICLTLAVNFVVFD